MDYWKLLTEGPLHASEEAAAADLKNDSKSKLVRYGWAHRFCTYWYIILVHTRAFRVTCIPPVARSCSALFFYVCLDYTSSRVVRAPLSVSKPPEKIRSIDP